MAAHGPLPCSRWEVVAPAVAPPSRVTAARSSPVMSAPALTQGTGVPYGDWTLKNFTLVAPINSSQDMMAPVPGWGEAMFCHAPTGRSFVPWT